MAPAATELPWQELHANLRAFIARRVRNQADVDDLVQRVLLQIVKGLGTLRDSERIHAWIYRTARNAIIDYYRSSTSRREVASGGAEDVAGTEPLTIQLDNEDVALRELASCLRPMLRELQPEYREAITLADLQGVNQADAAEQVGVSLSGMKSRIQRGRRQLKAVVEACCRIDLDSRGGIVGYEPRKPDSRKRCGTCGD